MLHPMLLNDIKAKMFQAIKAGDTVAKEILRVAVGEITTEAARPGRTGSDEEVQAILRKLIKSNEETIASADDDKKKVLTEEIAVLATFLPKSLDVDEILAALAPVADAIRSAQNDGQATGVAMKQLKASSLVVSGKDVSLAVKRIRA
jgi:uncharacterized protein